MPSEFLANIKPIFICLTLFFSVHVFAQQSVSNAVQITNEFDHEADKIIFYADNKDFCDYVVFFRFGSESVLKTVQPGKSELSRVKSPGISYSAYQFAMYRGNIDKKPDIDFAYCLPIAKGNSSIMSANVLSDGYQMGFTFHSDTIYASRGGIVCNDELTDFTAKGYQHFSDSRIFNKITIYHNDGTFGEYIFVGQPLVSPGNRVAMGQPIAVLGNNRLNNVSFSVYFLDKKKVNNRSTGNKHSHFRPFFQTNNEGKVRLEEEKIYYCELNNEMLMQDMSKRQRNNFLKNK